MTSETWDSAPHANDVALARAAKRGDIEAGAELVARMRCVRRILGAKARRLGTPLESETFEDLVQETLLVVWERLETYSGAGPLEAWIYRICHLTLLAKLRGLQRMPTAELFDDETHSPEQREELDFALRQERAYRALERLAPEDSRLIRARCLDGLDLEQLARSEATTLSAIRSRFYRALERVRVLLGESDYRSAPQERTK